jgi:hypothetical protein
LVLPTDAARDNFHASDVAHKLKCSEIAVNLLVIYGFPWWLFCVMSFTDKGCTQTLFNWFWSSNVSYSEQVGRSSLGKSHEQVNFSNKPLSFDQCSMAVEMVVHLMKTSQPIGSVPVFVKRFVPGLVLPLGDFQSELFMRRHELLAVSEDFYLSNGEGSFLDVYRWAVRGPLVAACKDWTGSGSQVEHGGELMVSVLYSLAYGVPDQLFGYLTVVREKMQRSWYAFREKPSKSFPDNRVRQIVPLINGVGVEMKLVGILKQLVTPISGTIVVQKNGDWQLYVPPGASDDAIVVVVAHYHHSILSLTKYVAKLVTSRK